MRVWTSLKLTQDTVTGADFLRGDEHLYSLKVANYVLVVRSTINISRQTFHQWNSTSTEAAPMCLIVHIYVRIRKCSTATCLPPGVCAWRPWPHSRPFSFYGHYALTVAVTSAASLCGLLPFSTACNQGSVWTWLMPQAYCVPSSEYVEAEQVSWRLQRIDWRGYCNLKSSSDTVG